MYDADRGELHIKCGTVAFARLMEALVTEPEVASELGEEREGVSQIVVTLDPPHPRPAPTESWWFVAGVRIGCFLIAFFALMVFCMGLGTFFDVLKR
jgi:hypothetical protein